MSGSGQFTPGRGVERSVSFEGPLLGTPKSRHDRSPIATPDRPRKKLKLEPKAAPTAEVAEQRELLCSYKQNLIFELKASYREHLMELCFLQDMGNIMDFPYWKRKPPSHVYQALRASRLDSDDEDEDLTEKSLNNEVKVLTTSRSSTPIGTPVAISTTLPPLVAAIAQGAGDVDKKVVPHQGQTLGEQGAVSPAVSRSNLTNPTSSSSLLTPSSRLIVTSSSTPPTTPSSVLPKSLKHTPSTVAGTSGANVSSLAGGTASLTTAGPMSAVPQSITGTQEAIVERAKQEAQVMQRVSELRKQGMWSVRRLPKVQEPTRSKAHWDYLLEEMQWLATDFAQERKWKKAGARKIANMIAKYHKEQQLKEQRAEKEESQKTRRIASAMARMVREFWGNIEKVVEYKQQSRLEEKRKKALDLHLSFIVDQTEKYSTWLTEGLATKSNSSAASSPSRQDPDNDFLPSGSASDDEETIAVEEEQGGQDEASTEQELEALKREMELPIEELLRSLPQEVLDKPADIHATASEESCSDDGSAASPRKAKKRTAEDAEFDAGKESSTDDEETLEQEEGIEKKEAQADNSKELQELEAEGELPLEELVKKYAGAYDSDFEENLPSDGSADDSDDDTSTATESDSSGPPSDEAEEEEDTPEDNWFKELDSTGAKSSSTGGKPGEGQAAVAPAEDGPGKELNDIAATARSIQPTGYTLETTKVRTAVPFLLKHTLREYQVVGLDWMATLYENRLNGILADEMGLGKTIQTISLLAHLACEKGVWGPHLIVVPTSVMLNWEMEFKKWCPAFKILTYFGSQKERKAKRQGWTKTNAFHVCITSYKLVIQDHQAFRRKKWKYLVLDEAQNIKNFKSQRWQTLLNFSSQRRLLLTGTPLQNNLMELWSLMHFLMPHVFQSHREFKEWFANPLTGMIEGSREYNDSLIKRLHKVLRPFLLRRLKADVEKQMPKKYEHVVRCHLSRRQRFLYDDFMSQTKTKETLATGHYMSVINILMQLRKVCNHPNLFDPRPIVSPFQMEGITFETASLVLRALDKDPLQFLRADELYPNLCELELRLPAFAACRAKRLQTSRKLIEEIDTAPTPQPRLRPLEKPVKLAFKGSSPLPPVSGRSSPFIPIHQRSGSPLALKSPHTKTPDQITSSNTTTPSVETTQLHQLPGHTPSVASKPSTPASTPTSIVLSSASTTQGSATSQPITVQIQNTPQGTRLMIPSGQLSQLPGYIQIVQTSSGQQIIATSQPPPNSTTGAAAVNGPVSTYTTAGTTPPVQLPVSSATHSKPVMRVSPLATAATTTTTVLTSSAGADKRQGQLATTTEVKSVIGTRSSTKAAFSDAKEKSLFFMGSVEGKRQARRRETLRRIARVSRRHCDVKPVYGQDFCQAVSALSQTRDSSRSRWRGLGYLHCRRVHEEGAPRNHPSVFWKQTKALEQLVHNPLQYLEELKEILNRFTFVVPPVMAPRIRMRAFHPPPSYLNNEQLLESTLHRELSPKAACLHSIATRMTVQFPEARLIQYDCGKLQTLDILLRRLKSGQHRVLIFTQMTKMLDVLEAFLNYHGHRYVRLDGTTKVEQRQILMERFNADKRIFVFILSTRSGGLGVNLTGADTVIFYDSDWNPTMDAQAQDRCHRIGQTRDVHIYRLISEKTIEENILKKANQKRLLGDVAIEGGNFTTAFFKQNTIQELFEEPSGLDALVKEKQEKERAAAAARARSEIQSRAPEQGTSAKSETSVSAEERSGTPEEKSHGMKTRPRPPSSQASAESLSEEQMEVVLGQAEDDADLQAAKIARAEQKAELAEFDEDIPWDEKEAEQKQCREQEMSRLEKELAMLEKELTPIERYAVTYMELEVAPTRMDELERAEEEVMLAKEEWELGRLKAMKEDEERRAELEDDEMLYTYSREDAAAQVYIWDETGEQMPLWAPPTPPQDDQDVYMDHTACFLYEPSVMPESQLPPIYVKKEHKRQRVDPAIGSVALTRKHKVRKEEEPRVPRSLFDRPSSLLRRDAKMIKLKQNMGLKGLNKPQQIMQRPLIEPSADHPEWLIHEDWALLQAVQMLLELPLSLSTSSAAHIPNWDLIADVVNSASRTYRSAKQCKSRYESTVVPREEGRILYDMNPRKQKKTKGIYKVYNTKNNRPMRTSQLYAQDNNGSLTQLYSHRFDSCKAIASKRTPTLRPTLANPTLKNLKHAAVLAENGISYDAPLTPLQVAQMRSDRMAKEKKEQLVAQKAQLVQSQSVTSAVVTQSTPAGTATQAPAQAQLTVVQATQLQAVATAAGATVVPASNLKTVAAVSLGGAKATMQPAGSIVVNTQGSLPQFTRKLATGHTVVGSLTQNVLAASTTQVSNLTRALPAVSARNTTSINVQEVTAAVNQGQARVAAAGAGLVTTPSSLTAPQLVAQKVGTTSSVTQLAQAKTLTPQHLQLFQRQALLNKQQQQRRAFHSQVAAVAQGGGGAQKTVAVTTPLITAQFPSGTRTALQMSKDLSGQKRLTSADMLLLSRQSQAKLQSAAPQVRQVQVSQGPPAGARMTTAQIIPGSQLQQSAQVSQPITTPGKAVSATQAQSVASVNIPISSVSLGINLPQQKTLGKASSQPAALQVRQVQQPRKAVTARVATLSHLPMQNKPGTPLLIPPRGQLSISTIQNLVKHQLPGASGTAAAAGMQQIITSVPPSTATSTVIATQIVTQPSAGAQALTRLAMPSAISLSAQAVRSSASAASGASPLTSQPRFTQSAGTLTPTVTLTHGSIVKEVLVSPAKAQQLKGVQQASLRQLPAGIPLAQPTNISISATGQTLSLPATSLGGGVGGVLTVQQLPVAKQQHHVTQATVAPSPGAQQAVKQVLRQAEAQKQQRPPTAQLQTPSITPTPATPTSAPSAAQLTAVQAAAPLQAAVTAASVLLQQTPTHSQSGEKNTYTMRLRNPPKLQ